MIPSKFSWKYENFKLGSWPPYQKAIQIALQAIQTSFNESSITLSLSITQINFQNNGQYI